MEEREPVKKVVDSHADQSIESESAETLVVVSKVKRMIRDTAGMNTSQCCIDALTKKINDECRQAIERAKTAGRKTVMGRDIV